jgi:hypothetical protein
LSQERVDKTIIQNIIDKAKQEFDLEYGGIKGAPKFPMESTLDLLIDIRYCRLRWWKSKPPLNNYNDSFLFYILVNIIIFITFLYIFSNKVYFKLKYDWTMKFLLKKLDNGGVNDILLLKI